MTAFHAFLASEILLKLSSLSVHELQPGQALSSLLFCPKSQVLAFDLHFQPSSDLWKRYDDEETQLYTVSNSHTRGYV